MIRACVRAYAFSFIENKYTRRGPNLCVSMFKFTLIMLFLSLSKMVRFRSLLCAIRPLIVCVWKTKKKRKTVNGISFNGIENACTLFFAVVLKLRVRLSRLNEQHRWTATIILSLRILLLVFIFIFRLRINKRLFLSPRNVNATHT